jgi:pimeloyl-ACP methyl ester carboxylesterase
MGGGVALQFAIQFPAKVEKLVLANSAGLGRKLAFFLRLVTLPLIGELLTRPSRKGTVWSLKQCVYDPTVLSEELIESSYNLAALPKAQKNFLSTLRACSNLRGQRSDSILSIVDNLASITAPTLIIWGQQGRILPAAHAHVARGRIPKAELHILNSCGHLPQLECSEEFNTLVLEFLARQEKH